MLQFRFAHRPRRDGSYASICTKCFATVAQSHNEADLETQGHCGGAKVGQLIGEKVLKYSGAKGLWSVAEEALHP
jgi:hypothetical protein